VRYDAAIDEILKQFDQTDDRYAAHARLSPLIERLCDDTEFLHEAIRVALSRPGFFEGTTVLSIPVAERGDIALNINLFAPIHDGAPEVAADYIHHHGWRLLTTGVISGGYDTIVFDKHSHEHRTGRAVALRIQEVYRHARGGARFVDSDTAHVVFHPPALSATLALWSADRHLASQGVKRLLGRFPWVRRVIVGAIHAVGLTKSLGLNAVAGVFYRPEGGCIVEAVHDRELDVTADEVAHGVCLFLQKVGFRDVPFLESLKTRCPPRAVPLVDKLIRGEAIPEVGVQGHTNRRFTKSQILAAISAAA
jgi:hypothetical protein